MTMNELDVDHKLSAYLVNGMSGEGDGRDQQLARYGGLCGHSQYHTD